MNTLLFFHIEKENMPIQVKCLESLMFLIALYSIFILRLQVWKGRPLIMFRVMELLLEEGHQ